MAEGSGEGSKRDWKSLWGIIKNTAELTVKPSVEIAKDKFEKVTLNAKEILESSKSLLRENVHNFVVQTGLNDPEKMLYRVSRGIMVGVTAVPLMVAASVIPEAFSQGVDKGFLALGITATRTVLPLHAMREAKRFINEIGKKEQ